MVIPSGYKRCNKPLWLLSHLAVLLLLLLLPSPAMLAAFLLPATLFRELPVLLVIPYGDQKCKNNA